MLASKIFPKCNLKKTTQQIKSILNLLIINVSEIEVPFLLLTICGGPWDMKQNPWEFENTETLFWNWKREDRRFRVKIFVSVSYTLSVLQHSFLSVLIWEVVRGRRGTGKQRKREAERWMLTYYTQVQGKCKIPSLSFGRRHWKGQERNWPWYIICTHAEIFSANLQ